MTNPRTAVVVPLVQRAPPMAEQVRRAVKAGADLVELRVDLIGDVAAVEALLRQPRPCPYILTVRPAHEGGAWDGDDAERVSLIERLALLGPGYVDVELSTWRRSPNVRQKIGLVCDTTGRDASRHLAGALDAGAAHAFGPAAGAERARNRLILSHHDFRATPADLAPLFDELAETPAFAVKAAFAARDARDALRVLDELRRRSATRRIVALSMGEAGLVTRVAAPKYGGFLTYATLTPHDFSAPGQPSLASLIGRYRWGCISAATRLLGVVGWPVSHSRGPAVHNAAMAAAGVDGLYLPLPVRPDADDFFAFMDFVHQATWLDVGGLSVTLPHKEHLAQWVHRRGGVLDPLAQRCAAANTLVPKHPTERGPFAPSWCAANTDGPAARESLAAALTHTAPWRVSVLGAGGAARAVVAELVAAGHNVTVFNRTVQRGRQLALELGCAFGPWSQRGEMPAHAVVNCTSVGLGRESLESPFPSAALTPPQGVSAAGPPVAFDTIYEPRETRFLREARAAGWRAVSGAEMFLRQAARQFELWHGRPPPEEVMAAAFDD